MFPVKIGCLGLFTKEKPFGIIPMIDNVSATSVCLNPNAYGRMNNSKVEEKREVIREKYQSLFPKTQTILHYPPDYRMIR